MKVRLMLLFQLDLLVLYMYPYLGEMMAGAISNASSFPAPIEDAFTSPLLPLHLEDLRLM